MIAVSGFGVPVTARVNAQVMFERQRIQTHMTPAMRVRCAPGEVGQAHAACTVRAHSARQIKPRLVLTRDGVDYEVELRRTTPGLWEFYEIRYSGRITRVGNSLRHACEVWNYARGAYDSVNLVYASGPILDLDVRASTADAALQRLARASNAPGDVIIDGTHSRMRCVRCDASLLTCGCGFTLDDENELRDLIASGGWCAPSRAPQDLDAPVSLDVNARQAVEQSDASDSASTVVFKEDDPIEMCWRCPQDVLADPVTGLCDPCLTELRSAAREEGREIARKM